MLGTIIDGLGLAIIELKKAEQTERQAFTELLAYANHFTLLFSGLTESSITSILVAPMETRIVRDAFFQQISFNNRSILALKPVVEGTAFYLDVHYPDEKYYRWIENQIFNDDAFITVVAAFPVISGWIDTDADNNHQPPAYSVQALNAISLVIAQRLEALGIHGMVYARQMWGEVADVFPNPNAIVVSVVNPFNSMQTSLDEGTVYGDSFEGRISEIQTVFDQLDADDNWISNLQSGFYGQIIRIVQESFDLALRSSNNEAVRPEISLPNWRAFKVDMLEAVTCHNLTLHTTGLLREVYQEYLRHIYQTGHDGLYYADDIPAYSYEALNSFLPIWEILSGLSRPGEEDCPEVTDDDNLNGGFVAANPH